MRIDPDGLWPRRTDAGSDGLDEDRDIDDVGLTLEEDLVPEGDQGDDLDWTIDADERAVDQGDDDDDRDVDEHSVIDIDDSEEFDDVDDYER
ncbi:MAG: DNA primase [Cellulomonas sp.]|nr:DNA primase [Cellulomonas sp.]